MLVEKIGRRDYRVIQKLINISDRITKFHNYKSVGHSNIPKKGRCLIASSHSLATYELALLTQSIYQNTGRLPFSLADDLMFKIPVLKDIATMSGILPANHKSGELVLKNNETLIVAPGGMRESLKGKDKKRTVQWDDRKGFVKLAIKTQSPIILAACPNADDIFNVADSSITKFTYKKFKIPVPFVKNLLPKKVELTHYLIGPFYPPKVDVNNQNQFKKAVNLWHKELVVIMNDLMMNGLENVKEQSSIRRIA